MHRALIALVACSAAPPQAIGNHTVPRFDPDLDSLSFLAGCWREFGYHLCWKRDDDAWTGRFDVGGRSWTILRIARMDLGMRLTADAECEPDSEPRDAKCRASLAGRPRLATPPACDRDRVTDDSCALGWPLVMFGADQRALWFIHDLANDHLLLGIGRIWSSMERSEW